MPDLSFEEWLSASPDNRELAAAVEEKQGKPLAPEMKAYLVNSQRRHIQHVQATEQWLIRAAYLAEAVVGGKASFAEYALFWIYLYGVVFDLREREADGKELKLRFFPVWKPYNDALDLLSEVFAADERTVIPFMRHNHAHVLVDYPWHRVKVKDGVVTKVDAGPSPETMDAVDRVLERFGGDQQAMARAFGHFRGSEDAAVLKQ